MFGGKQCVGIGLDFVECLVGSDEVVVLCCLGDF